MAIGPLQRPWHHTPIDDPFDITFNVTDIAIGGKLLQASMEIDVLDQVSFKTDDDYKRAIKHKIAADLARAMIESNLIEFTYMPQPAIGRDTIYARCYLAPNEQVKLLRTHYAAVNKR